MACKVQWTIYTKVPIHAKMENFGLTKRQRLIYQQETLET